MAVAKSFNANGGDFGLAVAQSDQLKGDVLQLADGRLVVVPDDVSLGTQFIGRVDTGWTFPKAASIDFLDGDEAWFSVANQNITYRPADGSADIYAGTVIGDTAAASPTIRVAVGNHQRYRLDLLRRAYDSVKVGTLALGGFGYPAFRGGAVKLLLDATNEAQKIDALGIDSMPAGTPAIVDIEFTVIDGSAGANPDFNVGLASATHASDFDSIAQYLAVHVDGNSTAIKVQAKDGTNTFAATATGVLYTAGSGNRNRVRFDMRDHSSVKVLVNGQRLSIGTINVSAAASAWKAIAHAEKTSSTDTFEANIERATARTMSAWRP